ncbi:MAG: UDP-N-acetylmuramate dehydrogenase [Deltaproteobacteria bacterium]|nr:UDP-N-acetylmuramate dehydrogenase [Deltaproteobacteria bacterium]
MKNNKTKAYSLLAQDFDLLENEPLKKHTSFKVGGPADLLAMPKNKLQLKKLVKKAFDLNIPVSLFGGGSNLLVTDKGIRGLVVTTKHLTSQISIIKTDTDINTKTINAEAGVPLPKLVRFATNQGLSGLEFAAGIPGTLGGAIMMNAGTKSGDMSRIVESVDVLNQNTFKIETIEKKDLDFSYRRLDQPGIILAASLKLEKAPAKKIKNLFLQNLSKKKATQPLSSASAGCFFKNPDQGKPAGELIEESGLKGMEINGAMVSLTHANFIVNTGNARCEDILLLKRHIQETVQKKYHIKLETEVRIEGE